MRLGQSHGLHNRLGYLFLYLFHHVLNLKHDLLRGLLSLMQHIRLD